MLRLTFDDGPSESTGAILNLLAEYGLRAHFFVIGVRAEQSPALVERAAAEGHVIGNHTWDHAALAAIPNDDEVIEQLSRTNDVVAEILGAPPALFRGPYGSVDVRVDRLAATLGLTHMGWDVVTHDFSAPDVETIASAILGAGHDEVVLLHDGNGDIASGLHGRPKTIEALARALPVVSHRRGRSRRLLIGTGARISEALALRPSDLQLAPEGGLVTVKRALRQDHSVSTPKSKRPRSIEIGPISYPYWNATSPDARTATQTPDADSPLFIAPAPTRRRRARTTNNDLAPPDRRTVSGQWHPHALRDAGLRHMPLHALRHTAAAAWLAAGNPLLYVQQQLGHQDLATTSHYYDYLGTPRQPHPRRTRHRASNQTRQQQVAQLACASQGRAPARRTNSPQNRGTVHGLRHLYQTHDSTTPGSDQRLQESRVRSSTPTKPGQITV